MNISKEFITYRFRIFILAIIWAISVIVKLSNSNVAVPSKHEKLLNTLLKFKI